MTKKSVTNKVAIMTDTNCAMSKEEGEELGIYVLPMPINIDGNSYMEGVDFTPDDLFEAMKEGKSLSTSQPAPIDVTTMWENILAEGYEEIIYIPMDSGLSGACHMAIQLSKDFDSKVKVLDLNRVSITQRYAVLDAKTMADKGMSSDEICSSLINNAQNASILIGLDTIEYLKRGGRINALVAKVASIMSIKPIVSIKNGILSVKTKVFGLKQAWQNVITTMQEELKNCFSKFPKKNIIVGTSGSFVNHNQESIWRDKVQEAFPEYKVEYWPLSASLSSHIGPNGFGIGIIVSEYNK